MLGWCKEDGHVKVNQGKLYYDEFCPHIICTLSTDKYSHTVARRLFKKGMDYQEIADYIYQDALSQEFPEV